MANGDPGDATEVGPASTPRSAQAAELALAITPGDVVHGHRIDRRLGAGGMGEVFAATRLSDGVSLALKLLARASATHLYRFKREFRALADVDHHNLVRLHELVVPRDGPAFFTMEFVDGEPFTPYVRGPTPSGRLPNLSRLERALRQLVSGVHELHAHQCLHRDLKPSNVLVDRSGRVVILDFGLISELDSLDEGVTHDGQLLGTPAYMAPEQAMSGKTGSAADLYAIGVMLFECLTGQRPFLGSAMHVMLAKQGGEIPDPGALVDDAPEQLRSICMQLLARDPQLRPTGRELLVLLGPGGPTPGASSSSSSHALAIGGRTSRAQPFIGRKREREQLHAALRDVEEVRAAVTVLVHGSSGYGKTALIRRFLAKLKQRERALILTGRCLERESVPYKGFDAIVDALSVHLRRLPEVETAALQPRHVTALIRLFPVLADLWTPAAAAPALADATEQRRLALVALRELLMRLGERGPLLLWVDDFQWADIDSVRLLAALLRPPDAPGLLLILSFRADLPSPALAELRDPALVHGREVRELELEALPQADALALASALLDEQGDSGRAEAIVRRAAGNPLFVAQLALAEDIGGAEDELEDILARRIAALTPGARELLAIVAIAGGPVPQLAALEAFTSEADTHVDGDASDLRDEPLVAELLAHGLLIRARVGPDSVSSSPSLTGASTLLLELAHSRVRAAVIASLTPEAIAGLHLQLAAALERMGTDPEGLAEHFARAGDRERAATYAERGAVQATRALAFARAVELYRRTLELLPDDADVARRRALQVELADQLINLGHSSAAADLLLELAASAEPELAFAHRRRAITSLARCGRIDEAIAIARELLDALGEPLPTGHWPAVFMFVRESLRLILRGERFKPSDPAQIPAKQLARLDTLLAVTSGLSSHEVMLSQALGARALRLALDAGDPGRIGLLLSYRYVAYAGIGQFERASAMAIRSRELASLADDPEVHRANDLSDAMVEWFQPRLSKARELFGRLVQRAEDAPLPDWIRSFATIRYAEISIMTGQLAEFRREHPRWVANARARGNLHELAALEGLAASVCVYYDELEAAHNHLEAARATWNPSRYTFTDITIDFARVAVLLHGGQLDQAHAQIEQAREQLDHSGLIHIRALAEITQSIHARSLIAQLLAAPANRELYEQARRAARLHPRTREPLRICEALTYQAALCSLAGDQPGARKRWRKAIQHCERHDMLAQLAGLRLRLAELTNGQEASELEASGLAYLSEQGITRRAPFVDMLAPARRSGY